MGVKPENHFPNNWKFDPQNEDVDDGIYKDSGFMFEIIISRNLEIWQILKLYMQGNQTASFNLKMLISITICIMIMMTVYHYAMVFDFTRGFAYLWLYFLCMLQGL